MRSQDGPQAHNGEAEILTLKVTLEQEVCTGPEGVWGGIGGCYGHKGGMEARGILTEQQAQLGEHHPGSSSHPGV